MAAVEGGLAVLVPAVAAAAFAALELLAQFCNLGKFQDANGTKTLARRCRCACSQLLWARGRRKLTSLSWSVLPQEAERL